MSKLKNFLPNLFGGNCKENKKMDNAIGRLESDALPVDQDGHGNHNNSQESLPSINNTPTASAELTDSVVRELSDPNYNSMEVAENNHNAMAMVNGNNSGPMSTIPNSTGPTMNTMNVHTAQQQVVMQFSNVNKLHFGSVYNFNSNITTNSSRKDSTTEDTVSIASGTSSDSLSRRQAPRKTTSIVVMMQSQEEPNHRILDTIATHLGEGWKQVMRDLGHSEGQIEQAIIDHQIHGGIKEVIYQLLLQWIRNADDGVATLGCLTTLLWQSNHRDCVQRMKLVWKSQSSKKSQS